MIEAYLQWTGAPSETFTVFGQDIQIRTGVDANDPIGTLYLNVAGFVGSPVTMPNSTSTSPTWTTIPGTVPTVEARQDGHFPIGLIQVRTAVTLIKEADTLVYNRPTLVDPPTAPDAFQLTYNGVRTVYANEYACLRVRGIPDNQVPARLMSHNTRDNTAHPIFQVGLSDAATFWFQVFADGQILARNNLSMLPDTPLAPTFTASTGPALLISDGATTGAPYSLTTTLHASDNRVYMDGAVVNSSGVSIPGGTVLFIIAAAHRPAAWVQFNERTSTTLSARVTVRPDGTVRLDQALAAAATCSFDGLNWRKA